MKSNRRNFLKLSGLAGLGMGSGLVGCAKRSSGSEPFPVTHRQSFNMSGYAAPKLDVVRIAVIGLGNRGSGTVRRLAGIEGVEIKAICDLVPEKVERAFESINHLGHNPDKYSGDPDDWKRICERPDIDLIAVVTPPQKHAEMCIYAMENDKHAYTELPVAITIDDCWKVVETSERTRKHCVQYASNCHSGASAVVLNMARQGFFGDIVHAEGAYIHQIIQNIYSDKYEDLWRLRYNTDIHANVYPQHGLVPICQMLDINYGDKMDYLSSVSSNNFMDTAKIRAAEDDKWKPWANREYRGNMNVTIIRTNQGRTIMMQHDTSSPRPNVRFNMLSGTKGIFQAPDKIATDHDGWLPQDQYNELRDKYTPEITKVFNELSRQARNIDHSRGYSRVNPTDWRLIDCLRNGLPMDMDVYEAAVSSSIIPLSAWSTANRSNSVDVPDFTSGKWKTNKRCMDIDLQGGMGSTRLL
jgi:hypothetical protein